MTPEQARSGEPQAADATRMGLPGHTRTASSRAMGVASATSRSVLPFPLPAEPAEFPIILEITDGIADSSIAHLPAATRELGNGNVTLAWDMLADAPPSRWVGRCGVDGWVYNRGGALAEVPICAACQQGDAA